MELKPCPRCGESHPYIYKDRYGVWRVFHHDISEAHYEKEQAIEAWNRRVGEENKT